MPTSDPAWNVLDSAAGTLTLRVHVQPGARRAVVAGVHGGRLKIKLPAPPVDGKANAALIAFVAEAFGVSQRNVELLAGATSRHKTLRVTAPARRPDLEWGLTPPSDLPFPGSPR